MRGAARLKWAAVVAGVAMAVAACGGGGGDNSGGAGVVRASWTDPQNPLEPANTNEVQGGKVLDMILRGLKRYDPRTGKAENWIADTITTKDSRNFTIKLKKGWRFSNGEKVTSDSFIKAWNYAALVTNKQINAPFFAYIDGYDKVHPVSGSPSAKALSGLKKVSDLEFTTKLSQKFSTWPDTLGYSGFFPLPNAFFTDHAGWLAKPVGNGPYKVDSYTKGTGMNLSKWDGYTASDKAQNSGVSLKVYTDTDTAYTDLLAGNLDLVDDVPAAQLKNVKSDLNGRYINQPAGILQTITFPLYDKSWNGPNSDKLRRGISMAINRAQITQQIFLGTRTPATDWTSPVLGSGGGYQQGLCSAPCTYDASKAKKLVQEAGGLPGGKMTITYNADSGSHKTWVDAVCNSINNTLGSDNACVGSPVGTFADFRTRTTDKQMTGPFRAGWQMDYPLIQDFLQPLYYTGASSNDSDYTSAEFDKLVNEANADNSISGAVSTFQKAEKVLAADMPAIPLWYQNGSAGYSDNLSNVSLNAFSVPVYYAIKVS